MNPKINVNAFHKLKFSTHEPHCRSSFFKDHPGYSFKLSLSYKNFDIYFYYIGLFFSMKLQQISRIMFYRM